MNYHVPKIALATSVIATGLLVACGGGGGGGGGTGTLNVSLTDAPACGFNEVNVTINKVRVHKSGDAGDAASGWVDIPVTPTKINLLNLTNGIMTTLGQTRLPVGRYTQLRLVLEPNSGGGTPANSVVPSTGGGEIALVTPSGATSGIKLNGNIDVTENTTTDIALDFDACKSIVQRGNGSYGLKPVINIIPIATSGVITGYVSPSVAAASKNAIVSAQVNGVIMRSTAPDPVTGQFKLSPISAGTYDIVISSDTFSSDVITDVPVTASGTTTLSTEAAQISLVTSPVADVSGTVTPAEAGATVAATQTFASGKKVVIRYQNADVTTGDYSMSLPTGAPRIGTFGAGTLPVTVNVEAALAGKFNLEASAEGYQSQSLPADISGGPATGKSFVLVQ